MRPEEEIDAWAIRMAGEYLSSVNWLHVIILGLIIPLAIILFTRVLFSFITPLRLGDRLAMHTNKRREEVDQSVAKNFFYFSGQLFFFAFISLTSLIYIFSVIYIYHNIQLKNIVPYFAIALIACYLFWLLHLFVSGYRYGFYLLDEVSNLPHQHKFYFTILDYSLYQPRIRLPRMIKDDFFDAFDTEKKMKARLALHRNLYKKDFKDHPNRFLIKDAIEYNEENIKNEQALVKTYTRFGAVGYKFLRAIYHLFLYSIFPIFDLIEFILNTFLDFFPAIGNILRKILNYVHDKPELPSD